MSAKKYSAKAREKFADSLFSLSNTLFTGLLVSVLLMPLAALLRALIIPGDDTVSVLKAATELSPGEVGVFILVYVTVVVLGSFSRSEAMRIYSELHPDAD